jgi:hypothetical protein
VTANRLRLGACRSAGARGDARRRELADGGSPNEADGAHRGLHIEERPGCEWCARDLPRTAPGRTLPRSGSGPAAGSAGRARAPHAPGTSAPLHARMPRRATLQWMEQASESWLRPLVVERARAPVSRTWSRERAPFARRPRSPTQFAVAAVVGGTPGTRRPLANRRHREPCRPSECSAHAFAVARRDQRAAVISTARVVRLAPRQDANVWNRGTCVAPLT